MDALGGGRGAGFWWKLLSNGNRPLRSRHRVSKPSNFVDPTARIGYSFLLKQAVTAGSLALTGDTIAQLRERWEKSRALREESSSFPGRAVANDVDAVWTLLSKHDWLRALRMVSYGFLFYGPGSYAWYKYLDGALPKATVKNLLLKVLLNQIVLGPSVIAIVFAWNNLWEGKLAELPMKYKKDALPTLLRGFRFWIPVSALNFWVIPLQARVTFMALGSIFWNFSLSSIMSK